MQALISDYRIREGPTLSNLQRAIEIAVTAHREQTRKNGDPYILHPLRLMMAVDSTDAKIVAVLHDVVEDTETTMGDMRAEGFSNEVLTALECVTHEDGISYEDYILRIKANPLATVVKLADLRDNSNLHELIELRERDLQRMAKYHRAVKTLTDC